MKFRFDRVSVSSLLLTICLVSLIPSNLRWASTWRSRGIWVIDRVARFNYEASIAFASLALVTVVLIVIWTSYQKRMLWAWFVMAVFVCMYFVPVHLIDVFLDIRRVGWPWWPGVVRDAREGRQFAQGALRELATLALMITALVLPVGDFFRKKRPLLSGGQSM